MEQWKAVRGVRTSIHPCWAHTKNGREICAEPLNVCKSWRAATWVSVANECTRGAEREATTHRCYGFWMNVSACVRRAARWAAERSAGNVRGKFAEGIAIRTSLPNGPLSRFACYVRGNSSPFGVRRLQSKLYISASAISLSEKRRRKCFHSLVRTEKWTSRRRRQDIIPAYIILPTPFATSTAGQTMDSWIATEKIEFGQKNRIKNCEQRSEWLVRVCSAIR